MRIGLLQLNPTVGDLAGNAARIERWVRRVLGGRVDLIVTSEMSITGYPPRDLLLQPSFVDRASAAVLRLAGALAEAPPVLVGYPLPNRTGVGRPLFNAAALLRGGRIDTTFAKSLLPTYDVFDEDRYFEPAEGLVTAEVGGARVGVSICEDVWNDRDFWRQPRYRLDPIAQLDGANVQVLINMSASPFTVGKQRLRERMLGALAQKHRVPVVYVNQVGGNDDLIFDGRSTAYTPDGTLVTRAAAFAEDFVIVDFKRLEGTIRDEDQEPEAEVWDALVLGTRDYARKCGFTDVVLGLSGGIDSALTAAVAADALGREHVLGVLMPSIYSSSGSVDDSQALARNLGIETVTLPIEPIREAFTQTLGSVFAGLEPDETEENIQARIRGALLMAFANKHRRLLLTTGNKSELSVGYCTLYGDMSGGLAVVSDVPKGMVYRLARYRNRHGEVIPDAILAKAPSAELRPDQTDQDSLPPYDVLDAILQRHIERHESAEEIVAAGFDEATVQRVVRLVRGSEFKRKQAAPGLRVTDRAFGTGWRMPIAARQ